MTTAQLSGASVRYGSRTVWSDLNLEVNEGEFIAVLGPNGAGKTTLLKVLLGLEELSSGTATIVGEPVHKGCSSVGYVPQQRAFNHDMPIRGRDLVRLGLDGHKWGFPFMTGSVKRKVDAAIASVGAESFADSPINRLSGGEQQRLRIAQALLAEPAVLLCDEPLSALDLNHQHEVVHLIGDRAGWRGTSVIFVTHDINPVLDHVDRVLYLVNGQADIGTPEEVLTSEHLSELYGAPIEVCEAQGRLVVIGSHEAESIQHEHGVFR